METNLQVSFHTLVHICNAFVVERLMEFLIATGRQIPKMGKEQGPGTAKAPDASWDILSHSSKGALAERDPIIGAGNKLRYLLHSVSTG